MSDHWVIDDITGFKVKASECRYGIQYEKGLFTKDPSEFDPQFQIRTRKENRNVPDVRLESDPVFITTPITADDL